MALTDLIPWGRNRTVAPNRFYEQGDPFLALHREMNRIFDDFARGFAMGLPSRVGPSETWPNVEVRETDKEVQVVAELPGMDQKDVALSLEDGVLRIQGEKKSESNGALYTERWHGRFQRAVQLGPDVDPDQVSAAFKDGVLTVSLAKRPEAQRQVKHIPISAS